MGENKLTLEDYVRYRQMLNPQKLAIVLILYASEVLEKMNRNMEAED